MGEYSLLASYFNDVLYMAWWKVASPRSISLNINENHFRGNVNLQLMVDKIMV